MAVFRRISILAALAALTMGLIGCERKITRVETTQEPQNCFTCHSDADTRLVDADQQWQNSRHSTGSTLQENDGTCKGCHTSEGFIARATGTPGPDVIDNPTAIHCFTCHAPPTNSDFTAAVHHAASARERAVVQPELRKHLRGLPPGASQRGHLHHARRGRRAQRGSSR